MRSLLKALTAVLFLFSHHPGLASEEPYYFYHPVPYGSEALFNPLTTIVNGGFGILQISNRSNKLSDVHFANGLKNVSYNLLHPLKAIERFGWKKFLFQEVIPTSVRLKSAQYYPNYYNHLIGGGFTYRIFVEWFRYHRYPSPKLWALASWLGYHLLNEVVENNAYVGPNVDPIADVYLFNIAGLLLFSSDKIARFFGTTLQMRDWSLMPAVDPWLNTLENVGQNFLIRYRLPFAPKFSVLYHWGVHGQYGVSYHREDGNTLSVAGGLVMKDLVKVNNTSGVRELTGTLVWSAGIFWDSQGSLLASLFLSGTKGYRARLNIYPGVIRLGRFSPGLFFNWRKDNQVVVGLQFQWLPVGLARRLGGHDGVQ